MALAWGQVIDSLIQVVETWTGRPDLERVCVVRDLRGRIRIAARAADGKRPDTEDLERGIVENLGSWFARPMLWTDAPSALEERRLAQNLIEALRTKWPAAWPRAWRDVTGQEHPIATGEHGVWCGELRARTKDIWLHEGQVTPPWPLLPQTPAIVSFYSFKGGVGRTTTLGIVARQLARSGKSGKRVVVVDLDLEAPGLGRFFDAQTERGVLDLLSEHAATGAIDLRTPELYSDTIDEGKGKIIVYPVGAMDESYVERLACLDYAPRARGGPSAVESALRAILEDIKRRHQPDYIFLDARAGLHDLGGLSLHALAHVDVLVGRAGSATLDGFQLVLTALSRRRRDEDLRVVTVQTFVPLPVTGSEHARIRDDWAVSLHDLFARTLYRRMYIDQGRDLPEVRDETGWHFPWVIPQYDSLGHADRIRDIDGTVIDSPSFTALRGRIVERCGRSSLTDEEVDDGSESEVAG
ncbi:MAG: ParA family protein [Polyangiaceae bacterium]|nr:ParA family protein [Polyangiaceae bacterium]